MKNKRIPHALTLLYLIAVICVSLPAIAGDDEPETHPPKHPAFDPKVVEEPAPSDGPSKLRIFGFLTQAWAKSNGATIAGIPESGTTDYRKAALLFRYQINPKDSAAVQFTHLRLGASPVANLIDDVQLNWAFYEHKFNDNTSIRVGRVLHNFGIYSEARHVGTLLPFYRPQYGYYGEVSLTLETVDGVVLSHARDIGSWNVAADVYGGGYREIEFYQAGDSTQTSTSRNEDEIGVQVWVTTPIEGVRLGIGGLRLTAIGSKTLSDGRDDPRRFYRAQLDVNRGPVSVQLEYLQANGRAFRFPIFAGHVGYQVTQELSVHGGLDLVRGSFRDPFPSLPSKEFHRDYILGVKYAFRPDLALKVENHQTRGYYAEDPILNPYVDNPLGVDYSIVSLSVTF